MSDATHFINGQWQQGDGSLFYSVNPANNKILWQGHSATSIQINQAVEAATYAFKTWSITTIEERIKIVKTFAELLTEHSEKLATIIAQETGKPLWESQTEITAMRNKIAISINAYHERTGYKAQEIPNATANIRHKPHGIVAIFGPYNFPGHLPNGHIVPALIAGNTIVFKPSELTPWTAQETTRLWHLAGLPKGVLNLVQGTSSTGELLANHTDINGLFFTGSAKIGLLLHQQFSRYPEKILALEMGGNNPLIVKGVKNTKAAVHDIIQSAFITTGQRCTCARRLFIETGKAGNALIEQLITATKDIKIADCQNTEQPFIGPMISEQAALTLLSTQESLCSLGGNALLPMKQVKIKTGFITPGIIDMTNVNNAPDEEYFGPLLQLYRYDDFKEAVNLANQTKFGLSAGLLADDKADYQYFYQHINAGIINWNKPLTGASSSAPFGGTGISGNHRASAYYAADYCAYPVASIEAYEVSLPEKLCPGLKL